VVLGAPYFRLMASHILNRAPGIAGHLLLNLRDASRHGDRAAFRWNMQRMGRELGSALAQSWPMADATCTTPLGTATERVPAHQPVLACILRASMPLHQGVMDVWDAADGAFVSAYRKHHDAGFDIEIEYLGAPSMEGRALVLVDPMLATGASLQAAYDALCETGVPASVHVLAAIASEEGLANAQQGLPEGTSFILGGVDADLNEHGYIVPGLGDAGDLAFGPKTRA
jgi:uracil phosphoribosyltransferase